MPTRTPQRAAKLKALREAVRLGFDALDRGEFKEFKDADELERYLTKITDRTIKQTLSRHSPRKWGIQ